MPTPSYLEEVFGPAPVLAPGGGYSQSASTAIPGTSSSQRTTKPIDPRQESAIYNAIFQAMQMGLSPEQITGNYASANQDAYNRSERDINAQLGDRGGAPGASGVRGELLNRRASEQSGKVADIITGAQGQGIQNALGVGQQRYGAMTQPTTIETAQRTESTPTSQQQNFQAAPANPIGVQYPTTGGSGGGGKGGGMPGGGASGGQPQAGPSGWYNPASGAIGPSPLDPGIGGSWATPYGGNPGTGYTDESAGPGGYSGIGDALGPTDPGQSFGPEEYGGSQSAAPGSLSSMEQALQYSNPYGTKKGQIDLSKSNISSGIWYNNQ